MSSIHYELRYMAAKISILQTKHCGSWTLSVVSMKVETTAQNKKHGCRVFSVFLRVMDAAASSRGSLTLSDFPIADYGACPSFILSPGPVTTKRTKSCLMPWEDTWQT
jgi:hypothetical protein